MNTSTLSDKLRAYRHAKGWTLHSACLHGDLSVSHLSEMERGLTEPSQKTARKLAGLYGVSVSELFERVTPTTTDAAGTRGVDDDVYAAAQAGSLAACVNDYTAAVAMGLMSGVELG